MSTLIYESWWPTIKDKIPVKIKGEFVENNPWDPSEYFSFKTSDKYYPVKLIRYDRVISVDDKPLDEVKGSTVDHIQEFIIPSSRNVGEYYTVRNNNGTWTCTCPGFIYHSKCKHINEARGIKKPDVLGEFMRELKDGQTKIS